MYITIAINILIHIMVSNFYLADVLGGFKSFKGVFASDTLPENIFCDGEKSMSFIIVNTEDLSSPKMGHWISISKYDEAGISILEVFDSLAYPISLLSQNIKRMIMRTHFDVLKTNQKILQALTSNFCGIYCIARFVSLLECTSLTNFLKNFGDNRLKNDKIAVDYIRRYKC